MKQNTIVSDEQARSSKERKEDRRKKLEVKSDDSARKLTDTWSKPSDS
ncbi:hypothetical protein [Shewanella sp. UCD-KL12]|nr:hypothetical protein [Shewanella sp. UCD-KL12]